MPELTEGQKVCLGGVGVGASCVAGGLLVAQGAQGATVGCSQAAYLGTGIPIMALPALCAAAYAFGFFSKKRAVSPTESDPLIAQPNAVITTQP